MMFKQITYLMFSVALIFGLIGCSGSTDGNSSDSNDSNGSSGGSFNFTDDGSSENSTNNGTGTGVVEDSIPPLITIKGKSVLTVIQNSTYKDAGATARDNVDGTVKVITTGNVNSSKIGTYIITYTATDKAGNRATAKRTVKVVAKGIQSDRIVPVITIKGNNPVTITQNSTYKDTGATARDNVDGTVNVITSGSVDSSKVGTYIITYTATDKAGNRATAKRTVKVVKKIIVDNTPPIITISGDNPLEVTQGETFADPGATATDDRDGTVAVTPSGTVDMSTVANYTITYTATDKVGNKTTATRTVTVKPADVVWEVSNMAEFRQALEDAAANGESDRIVLAKGTYNVTSDGLGTLKFDDNEAFNLTIQAQEGLTFKDVILDGNNSTQVFKFNNTASATLIFKGVSVINGKNGIYCNKNIEIKDCNISNNSSRGFYSKGSTKVTNSTISNNKSSGSNYDGGGGFYSNGKTTVTNSTISNNTSSSGYGDGGGFYSGSTTIIINSTISNNSNNNRGYHGGGGGFYSNGTTSVKNSTISNNSSSSNQYGGGAGGGFYSRHGTTITDSIISNNNTSNSDYYNVDGGGSGFYSRGETTVKNSTISNNRSRGYYGGGFYSTDTTTVSNSTISNNSATIGGGFYSTSTTTVTNSIFSENNASSGAIFYAFARRHDYSSYISNNSFIGNKGLIYAQGVFVNNIFDSNDKDINLVGNSKIYNNYIDYDKIENNSHNVIKKRNLQPASVGDVYLTSKYALESESPVIDKGLNPSSATYKKIIANDTIYNKMLELLKTDKVGNKRIHNNTIDMGAVEFGSSK